MLASAVMAPRPRLVVSAVLATSIAFAIGAPASAGRGRADRSVQERIDALVAHEDGPPGAIVIVHRGDARRVFRAGVSNLETRRPMQPWMHMRIASTAKAYSGAVALSLVDRGVLALDDTVGDLLPWTNADWHGVTLEHLLQHTSGIPDFTGEPEFIEQVLASPDVAPGARQLLDAVADHDLEFDPGTRYAYSNSDNVLVGLMAKAVTGVRYGQLLEELVTSRLQLHDTSLPRGVRMPRPFVRGYQWAGDDPPEDVTTFLAGGWAWASGGIVSTPLDQDRFIRAYVGGRLVGPVTQEAQFRFVAGGSEPTGPGSNEAGLAIFRYRLGCGVVFGHTGNTFGFTQFFAANRSGRRSVVVSVNRQITPTTLPDVFVELRRVFARASCAALA